MSAASSGSKAKTSDVSSRESLLWGILSRKQRWGLSGRGWLILAFIGAAMGWVIMRTIYPFLAVTDRVKANVLVVEGWVHYYAIRAGADEFRAGSYQHVFATGGPVAGTGKYTSDYMTSAHVGADLLLKAGLPEESLEMVASRVIERDRTYYSAVALRDRLHERGMIVRSINVVTENVHARRTRMLYQMAFGNDVKVGIIAARNPDYEAKRWWRCSEGVREVMSESIAYLYAKLFFYAPRTNYAKKED
jgi:uncharacterized SAM-binding protein YcdF (DUF218 family)